MGIKLLDCTLRDGGHLNNSKFGDSMIRDVVNGLVESKVDYIEIGFVREEAFGDDYAAVDDINDFQKRFPMTDKDVEYTVMIQEDQYDINRLPAFEEQIGERKIKRIRVSFHDYDRAEGLQYCREVIKKGYEVHVNPINVTGYSDQEFMEIIHEVNSMGASIFTLVDTFGSMTKDDLMRMFMLADNNLAPKIGIGFHLHDNLQMAFSLAQTVIEVASDKREIIIDASLLGMGREPGNLCLELIMEYMNRKCGSFYDVDAALDLIDTHIARLKAQHPWGYETAYALSAQYKMHRSYAEYLMKQKLKTKQIKQILGMVEKSKRSRYDEKYIESLYHKTEETEVDDSIFRGQLKKEIGDRPILLIAPGNSLNQYRQEIDAFIVEKNPFIITANFKSDWQEDYIFCSNIKRLDRLKGNVDAKKVILAAYLDTKEFEASARANTNELGWFGTIFWDNCMLMLIHLLKKIGVNEISLAGWDGFKKGSNFVDETMESIYHYEEENSKVTEIIGSTFRDMKLNFLTPSEY